LARIALCTQAIGSGDAITNDVLAMFRLLSTLGHECRIFSECVLNSETPTPTWPIEEAQRFLRSSDSILILHFGLRWDAGIELLKTARCRKVFRYHNVTPPELFEGVNSGYENACRIGKAQAAAAAALGTDLFLPNSQFSVDELIFHGAPPRQCHVVPPFHQADLLYEADADLSVLDHLNDGSVNLLTVGRVSPNKGHPLLIDAFAAYYQLYQPNSRLIITGGIDPALLAYLAQLREQIRRRRVISRVVFAGKVSLAALKAHYLAAGVFLVGSRHEGFCVPLVEAMRLRVPVVGFGCPAVRETLGDAGLLWETEDPILLAASIHRVASDQWLTQRLTEAGFNRYASRFSDNRIQECFLESLQGLL